MGAYVLPWRGPNGDRDGVRDRDGPGQGLGRGYAYGFVPPARGFVDEHGGNGRTRCRRFRCAGKPAIIYQYDLIGGII
jgi:hypothetical protein